MLTRPSNFDDAYSSTKYISSSNIYIEDKDNNTLLTKENLGEYKCYSRSSFLNETLPMEDTTFVVLDWKNIPQATKTYLTTRHNVIYVKYEVNNVKSTGARFCFTDSAKIDYNGEKATIKCVSPINTLGGTANIIGRVDLGGYYIIDTYLNNLYYGDNHEQIFLRAQGVNALQKSRNFWYAGTNAEMVQNGLIALGGSLRFNTNYYNLDSTRGQIVSRGNAYNNRVSFDPVNIHEDIDKDVLNIPTTGHAYGYTFSSVRLIVDGSVRPTSTTYTTTTTIKDHCKITRATLTQGSGSPTLSTITQTKNSDGTSDVYMVFTGCTPSSNYVLSIYGQDIVEPTIQNIDGEVAVYSKLLEGNESRNVHNTELSFSCRINPCIEVLDCLKIRNIGFLYVEQVDIEFNGAYRGKIVGKLNENLSLSLTKTINSETNYTITFTNNSAFDSELYIGNTSIGSITADATEKWRQDK